MPKNVQEIMHQLTKAIKSIQLYGINHPSAQQVYQPLFEALTGFLKNYGQIELDINQYSISSDSQVVYQEREKDVSIAFRLFRDGVRNIKIVEEMEFDEMMLFLEVISQTAREQDIALNLWECNFSHIDFYVIEEEDEDLSYELPVEETKDIDFQGKLAAIIAREKLDMTETIDPALSEAEMQSLKTQMAHESDEAGRSVAISTLINFLQHDKSPEIIDSLKEILAQCIDQHEFHNARLIATSLERYAKVNAIDRYEQENTILDFKNFINTIADEAYNQFLAFIALFTKKSLPYFIRLMPSIQRSERLERFRDQVAYIAQNDYHPVLGFLQSGSVDLIINTVAVLSRLSAEGVIGHLEGLAVHPRVEVRCSLINAYRAFGQPARIAGFLDDDEAVVRIKSLQSIALIVYPPVYYRLIARIKSRAFSALDMTEQKAIFTCLIANGGPGLIKILEKMLFRRMLFGRKRYRVVRRLAAWALEEINSDEARTVLEQGLKKRNADIRQACETRLKQ